MVEVEDLKDLNALIQLGWDYNELTFVSSEFFPKIATTVSKKFRPSEEVLKKTLLYQIGALDFACKLKTSPQRIGGSISVSFKDFTGGELQTLIDRGFTISSVGRVPGEKTFIVYATEGIKD